MDEMKEQSSQTAERINALQRRMGQVRAIADTVKDLADQSNMLALNAAIEAVRSGEHGKGFALVAREIRRLADQSIQATDQVREILESVASELNEAVEVAGRGARRMEGEMAEVRKSGRSLSSLADLVRTTAGSVGQIATAVTQQDEGIGHIFGAVTRQSEMMERTQVQLGEVRASLDQLKALSASLTDMVGQYRT
jgi:methyl-accepting chemotaxis protein